MAFDCNDWDGLWNDGFRLNLPNPLPVILNISIIFTFLDFPSFLRVFILWAARDVFIVLILLLGLPSFGLVLLLVWFKLVFFIFIHPELIISGSSGSISSSLGMYSEPLLSDVCSPSPFLLLAQGSSFSTLGLALGWAFRAVLWSLCFHFWSFLSLLESDLFFCSLPPVVCPECFLVIFFFKMGLFLLSANMAWSARYLSNLEFSLSITFQGSFFSCFWGICEPKGVMWPVRMSSSHSDSWAGIRMLLRVDGPGSNRCKQCRIVPLLGTQNHIIVNTERKTIREIKLYICFHDADFL